MAAQHALSSVARGRRFTGTAARWTVRALQRPCLAEEPVGQRPDKAPGRLREPANRLEDRVPMMQQPRLRSLQERHAHLERQIAEEGNRPQPDAGALGRLKLAKLRLKEEMQRLRPGR
ncbi:YdcH family protein [Teichococcus aerofrigidensis]